MKRIRQQQRGFTIVELMIATVVFSTVLVIIVTGVVYFSNQYYRGMAQSRTQTSARAVVTSITQAIQFSSGNVFQMAYAGGGAFCIGERRYTFIEDKKLVEGTRGANETYHSLVTDQPTGGCTTSSGGLAGIEAQADLSSLPGTTDPQELLGTNMRLMGLEVNPVGTSGLYEIKVGIAYGDQDLVNGTGLDQRCNGGVGSHLCAVSVLTTTVQKRIQY